MEDIYILNIETSTKACSVSLNLNGDLMGCEDIVGSGFSHSEKLLPFISQTIEKSKIKTSDLSAVAISMGPGSFTGLRIGVSTAKGICYALGIPLIAVSTLQAMAFGMAKKIKSELYCPMIDARRMEVYSAFYDLENNLVREIQADIVNESSYLNLLNKDVVFFGDGSIKIKEIIKHQNATFISDFHPSATFIGDLSYKKFRQLDFVDIAYFEPYYLKDFVGGKKA
jgi:tRNA threonylcarbamoyladenosine biosynthesis protein TsaB